MFECAARLWMQLSFRCDSGGSLPNIPIKDLLSGAEASDHTGAIQYLLDIGALNVLSDQDRAKIASGGAVGGRVIAVTTDDQWIFFRVAHPQDLQAQMAAQLSLPEASSLDTIDVDAIIAEIGLTNEQLEEAKQYPLAEDEWDLMRDMPAHFFLRAWKRMESEGNAEQMMMIAASLGRLIDYQIAIPREADERKKKLKEAFTFVSKVVGQSSRESSPTREPIPEAVRHEVWRRDMGHCVKCGSQERLHFDHIIPVSKGGSNTARNIQLLCEKCNLQKSDSI